MFIFGIQKIALLTLIPAFLSTSLVGSPVQNPQITGNTEKNRLVELRFPWHTSPPTLKNSKTLELSKLTQTQSAISHFKIWPFMLKFIRRVGSMTIWLTLFSHLNIPTSQQIARQSTRVHLSYVKTCGQPSITESHTRELWKMGSGNSRQRLNQLKLFPCDAVPKLILSNE